MTNFNYKQFHTEVEQFTQRANWLRQGGNRKALSELRQNSGVCLPPASNGQYARQSFWYVFKYSFIPRVTGADTQRAAEAIEWLQRQMKYTKGKPLISIESKFGKTATFFKQENSTL